MSGPYSMILHNVPEIAGRFCNADSKTVLTAIHKLGFKPVFTDPLYGAMFTQFQAKKIQWWLEPPLDIRQKCGRI